MTIATSSDAPVTGIWAFVRASGQERASLPEKVPPGQAAGGGGCLGDGEGLGLGLLGLGLGDGEGLGEGLGLGLLGLGLGDGDGEGLGLGDGDAGTASGHIRHSQLRHPRTVHHV